MTVSVRLNLSRLRRVIAGTPGALGRGAEAHAEAVAELARELVPVDTGELQSSIHVEDGALPASRRVVASAAHAPHVEYGTVHMAAQPFMTPAGQRTPGLPFYLAEMKALLR